MKIFTREVEGGRLHTLPALSDNYLYLLDWGEGMALVDAGEAGPALGASEVLGVPITDILVTHGHGDHVGGLRDVAARSHARVVAPAEDRIGPADLVVSGGDEFAVGPFPVQAISTPGHTRVHLVYHVPGPGLLFSGDTLFLGGCGRLFEGSPAQMWDSLQRLAGLPDETLVCCGHEYTRTNLDFAASILPDDPGIREQRERMQACLDDGQPTVPGTLAGERRSNLFLRAGEPAVAEAVGLPGAGALDVFTELRERRNQH